MYHSEQYGVSEGIGSIAERVKDWIRWRQGYYWQITVRWRDETRGVGRKVTSIKEARSRCWYSGWLDEKGGKEETVEK